ncbi:hypothetical protein EDB84DRAFT_1626587 [Lactarius hengduanensis]|nr:hypothetical protein EDB84DRAFT_1626587 [Lactarius hengduanensis]
MATGPLVVVHLASEVYRLRFIQIWHWGELPQGQLGPVLTSLYNDDHASINNNIYKSMTMSSTPRPTAAPMPTPNLGLNNNNCVNTNLDDHDHGHSNIDDDTSTTTTTHNNTLTTTTTLQYNMEVSNYFTWIFLSRCTGVGTRKGCPPFARGPTASLRLVNDAHPLRHTREGVPEPSPLPFAPPLRSAHPSVSAQLPYPGCAALPRPHTLCAYAGGEVRPHPSRACVRPSLLRAPLGGGTRKPGLSLLQPPSMQGEGEARRARARRVNRGGVAWPGRRELGAGATRRGGVACPHVPPFRANEERRGRGEGGDGVPCVHPFHGKGGTGGGVPSCAPFPRERPMGQRGQGKGGRGATGAVCPRAPPFRANVVVRTGEKGGVGGRRALCAPLPRERGGADTGGGAVRPLSACERGGGGQCGGRKGGGCATYHGVPPFRANVAARTEGEGRGRGLPSCAPLYAGRGGASASDGVGEGSERSGGRGGQRSGRPTLFAHPILTNWVARNRAGMREDEGGMGPVPVAEAKRACHNWVCKERKTPTLPAPPSTPPAPLAHPIRGRRPSPPCIERGARGGAHHDKGRTAPPPVSAPPRSRGRGAHNARRPPTPPFSPVRTTTFARKGGARGHTAPVAPRPPFPCPRCPMGRSRGKGAHEGTPPPVPPFPWKGCTQGHATPPLRVAPAPSSLRPGHATPPLFTRRARARLVTQKGRRAPRPVPSARATPAQPHAPRLALPLHAGGLQEGLRAHPQPPGLRGGQRAHPGHRRAMPSPGFARIAPPVHARGRKRDGTRTSPGLRVPPPRGARKREGRTHAREG